LASHGELRELGMILIVMHGYRAIAACMD